LDFVAGSMRPKVEAAIRFADRTGKRAAIGSLADIEAIVNGDAGTQVIAQSASLVRPREG
jgi:carbamate kinase